MKNNKILIKFNMKNKCKYFKLKKVNKNLMFLNKQKYSKKKLLF